MGVGAAAISPEGGSEVCLPAPQTQKWKWGGKCQQETHRVGEGRAQCPQKSILCNCEDEDDFLEDRVTTVCWFIL